MRHDREANAMRREEKVISRVLGAAILIGAGWCTVAGGEELSSPAVQRIEIEALLDVLACVESNNNPDAVGDRGRALGAYQIHQAYWEDGTRLLGVSWPYRAALDPDKARCVVRAYVLHYGADRGLVDMARIHNGGPSGYRRRSTLSYAQRVNQLLIQRLRVCQTTSPLGSGMVPVGTTVAGSAPGAVAAAG